MKDETGPIAEAEAQMALAKQAQLRTAREQFEKLKPKPYSFFLGCFS